MPAIIELLARAEAGAALEARQQSGQHNDGRKYMSGATISFLVPLFVIFLVGPFISVWLIRKRRDTQIEQRIIKSKDPVMRREEAKEMLKGVTTISTISDVKYRHVEEIEEKGTTDSASILERDCAICLSTLHAPTQPEPAKLMDEAVVKEGSGQYLPPGKAASVSESSLTEKEDILKLNVCTHEFHAECLTSWFLMRRYTCPICRAIFFDPEAEVARLEQEVEASENSPTGRDIGRGARQREEV
ncbi:hypothetical protein BDV96DRAFT_77306 [Lophiotrema nucula]|uniref:RING-type domain-containing protein n=1 Tax=Lophiotrema nucula TaxID=690887 RepID=A0A6A5Z894_9PLEO|nr:hypothetical protein BDV96DRAFT_77306 [Lophiotrema nucula]